MLRRLQLALQRIPKRTNFHSRTRQPCGLGKIRQRGRHCRRLLVSVYYAARLNFQSRMLGVKSSGPGSVAVNGLGHASNRLRRTGTHIALKQCLAGKTAGQRTNAKHMSGHWSGELQNRGQCKTALHNATPTRKDDSMQRVDELKKVLPILLCGRFTERTQLIEHIAFEKRFHPLGVRKQPYQQRVDGVLLIVQSNE